MEQVKALNALEPFIALSKSATSPRAAAEVVTRATSQPNTFVFAELLQTPQIQALSGSEYATHLALLQIFSYGTYADYTSTKTLPPLNDAQTLKLRQLSILTLVKDKANRTYTALISQLGLTDARELEQLLISTIYAGLIAATLDPQHQAVLVSSIAPLRDLAPGSVPQLLSQLTAWSSRCGAALADISADMDALRRAAVTRAADKEAWSARLAHAVEEEGRVTSAAQAGHDGGSGGNAAGKKAVTSRPAPMGPGGMAGAAGLIAARFGSKRSSSNLLGGGGADQHHHHASGAADDEAMDLDYDEDAEAAEGKKRASRRKL